MDEPRHLRAAGVSVAGITLNEVVRGRRRVTTDTALRLARYFGTTAEFWIRLQVRYDLDHAEWKRWEIEREVEPHSLPAV